MRKPLKEVLMLEITLERDPDPELELNHKVPFVTQVLVNGKKVEREDGEASKASHDGLWVIKEDENMTLRLAYDFNL